MIDQLKELKFFLSFIFKPSTWLRNYPTNKEWDRECRRLISNATFKIKDRYLVEVDGRDLWWSNYPYASFNCGPFMPTRRTVELMMNKIATDHIKNGEKGYYIS